jgi:hypothetical protein
MVNSTKVTSPRVTPRQFTYKGAGGGIWTYELRIDISNEFLRSFFPPFSLLGSFAGSVKESLAGDEINESKNSQLPLLRENVAGRVLEGYDFYYSGYNQVPSLRQSEVVERRKTANSFGKNTAIPVQRMRPSFLEVLNLFSLSPSFFFFQGLLRSVHFEMESR